MPALKPEYFTVEDYYDTPEDVRVELIDGEFYDLASPSRIHQKILGTLFSRISNYIDKKKGSCEVYPAPFAVQLSEDQDTVVEPDISVICDKDKLTDRGCTGAPDWIIEIVSPGNINHDYVKNLNLYLDAGVREYWIVNPLNESIFVYRFEEGAGEATAYTFKDVVKAGIYEDLEIDFKELLLE